MLDLAGYIEQCIIKARAASQAARIDLDKVIDQPIAAQDIGGAFLDHPGYLGFGTGSTDSGERRERMHDIADAAEFDDEDPHLHYGKPLMLRVVASLCARSRITTGFYRFRCWRMDSLSKTMSGSKPNSASSDLSQFSISVLGIKAHNAKRSASRSFRVRRPTP